MSTKDDYVASINKNLKLDENKIEGTFGQDIVEAVAYELAVQKDTQIDTLLSRAFVSTAHGDDLDLCGADVGLSRKQATKSKIDVRITGNPDQVVSTAVKISYDNVVFTSTENKTIPSEGYIDVVFQCDTAGILGNIASGTIFDFVGSYYGLKSAVAISKGVGGSDNESDEDYRTRLSAKIRNEASSGNKAHYKQWAESVDGVSKSIILPLWNGNGTVKVLIATPDKSTPSEELLNKVRAEIANNAPIGATVTVASVDYVDININANVQLDKSGSPTTVKNELNVFLTRYLDTTSTTVSYLRISDLLFSCSGVTDVNNYTINGGTKSITLTDTQVARTGTITVNGE